MAFHRKNWFVQHLSEFMLVLLTVGSGILLAINSGGFLLDFNRIGFTVMSTMSKYVYVVTDRVADSVNSVRELSSLKKKYEELSEKLKDYEYMRRNNAEIREENERLREQLDFSRNIDQKNIVSQIIARDLNSTYSSLTIDKGSKNGIRKNMPVIAIQNGNVGVVGKVVTVGYSTSMVMPLYSTQCNISARIQNTRDVGLAKGLGTVDGTLQLQYIRNKVANDIQDGDVIVTSGENDNYMRDIPIGTVTHVEVLDYDSSLSIEIAPIIDFARLETVIVVDQSAPNVTKVDVQ
jgi:rod shape-determining protein MreC